LSRSGAAATLVLVSSGQASTDYAAVLLVVLALVAGVASWAEGHALADGVEHAFARALCVVRGGDCDVDALPCITAVDETRTDATLKLAFIRLDGRTALLRQTRSDGTVLITKGMIGAAGPTAGIGTAIRLDAAGVKLRDGASVEASVTGLFERSHTWVVHGRAAADRLAALLKRRPGPGEPPVVIPPPDFTTDRRGLRATIDGIARKGRIGATLGLTGQSVQEVRRDEDSGRRTLLIEHDRTGSVSLTVSEIGARADGRLLERYGVTLDRDGRPVDLVVLRQGALQGSADLPRRLQAVAGLLATPTRGGRIWAEETHLDLTDPANLAVARGFLAQVTDPSAMRLVDRVRVARALAARLEAVGVEHVRTLAVDETRIGLGGVWGAGPRIGADVFRTSIHQRLLDAATRGVDGVWRRRADCLAAT
jgi:hypothetical protein